MFTYLLVVEIFPRMNDYIEQQQIFTYSVMVFGHGSIGLLSLYWCIVMCKGGLKSLFVFKKKTPKVLSSTQGFSFADEVAGKNNTPGGDSPSSPERLRRKSSVGSPLKIIADEAQAYKDGTIFTEELAPAKKLQ